MELSPMEWVIVENYINATTMREKANCEFMWAHFSDKRLDVCVEMYKEGSLK